MRTRSRTLLEGQGAARGTASGTTFHAFDTLAYPYTRRAEFQQDIQHQKGEFNPVSHTRMVMEPGTPVTYVHETIPPLAISYVGDYMPPEFQSPSLLAPPPNGWDLESAEGFLPSGVAEDFTRDAFMKCLDLMPEKISIANFLLELTDLRGLISNIKQYLSLPGAYLSWNFGWMPLIQDIKAIITLVQDILARLMHLKKINRRWVTITHTRMYSVDWNGQYADLPDPTFPALPPMGVINPHYQCEALIRMATYYDLNLYGADVALRSLCAALGIDNLAKIVWNAIPFSFVLDWFINLSEFLDQTQSAQAFEGTLKFGATSCSFKTTASYEAYSTQTKGLFGNKTYANFGKGLVIGYHRRKGLPAGNFELSGLTPNQQALALALLAVQGWPGSHSRMRRRRPR